MTTTKNGASGAPQIFSSPEAKDSGKETILKQKIEDLVLNAERYEGKGRAGLNYYIVLNKDGTISESGSTYGETGFYPAHEKTSEDGKMVAPGQFIEAYLELNDAWGSNEHVIAAVNLWRNRVFNVLIEERNLVKKAALEQIELLKVAEPVNKMRLLLLEATLMAKNGEDNSQIFKKAKKVIGAETKRMEDAKGHWPWVMTELVRDLVVALYESGRWDEVQKELYNPQLTFWLEKQYNDGANPFNDLLALAGKKGNLDHVYKLYELCCKVEPSPCYTSAIQTAKCIIIDLERESGNNPAADLFVGTFWDAQREDKEVSVCLNAFDKGPLSSAEKSLIAFEKRDKQGNPTVEKLKYNFIKVKTLLLAARQTKANKANANVPLNMAVGIIDEMEKSNKESKEYLLLLLDLAKTGSVLKSNYFSIALKKLDEFFKQELPNETEGNIQAYYDFVQIVNEAKNDFDHKGNLDKIEDLLSKRASELKVNVENEPTEDRSRLARDYATLACIKNALRIDPKKDLKAAINVGYNYLPKPKEPTDKIHPAPEKVLYATEKLVLEQGILNAMVNCGMEKEAFDLVKGFRRPRFKVDGLRVLGSK